MAEEQLDKKDLMLDFGAVTSSSCENVINLGATTAGGFEVVFTLDAAVSSASAFTVSGSEDGSSYTVIAASPSKTFSKGEAVRVAIPRGDTSHFLKVSGPASKACLDTYVGK